MPNDPGQEIAPTQNRGVAAVFQADLDAYTPNLMQALPSHVSVEKFKRVLITAVSSNPDLLYANRRTLFNAAVRCASDGLIPDGREAALVVYRTKMKRRNPQTGLDIEEYVDAVQCMPMVAGIRKRMRNTGDVLSADAHVVYENDRFKYKLGDDGFIDHEPAGLSENPGKPVGAYAIIKLKSGEVLRDVLRLSDIEKARNVSRAKTGPMWTTFWDEAARKTALRRCAKAAPQSAELEGLLIQGEDDEPPMIPAFEPMPALSHEPEPLRPVEPEIIADRPVYTVVDLDGVEHEFREEATAEAALIRVLDEAGRLGSERLAGAWDSNTLQDKAEGSLLARLTEHYEDVRRRAEEREKPAASPAPKAHNPKRAAVADPARPPPPEAQAQTQAVDGSPAPQPWPLDNPRAGAEPTSNNATAQSRPTGALDVVEGRTAGSIPATGATAASDSPAAQHVHERGTDGSGGPATAGDTNDDPDRGSLEIAPPIRRGKPDWRTWTIALFLPKVRQAKTVHDLAFLCGDNDENLTQAKAELARDDKAMLEEAIAQRYREIGDD